MSRFADFDGIGGVRDIEHPKPGLIVGGQQVLPADLAIVDARIGSGVARILKRGDRLRGRRIRDVVDANVPYVELLEGVQKLRVVVQPVAVGVDPRNGRRRAQQRVPPPVRTFVMSMIR